MFESGNNRKQSYPDLCKNYCLYGFKDRTKCPSCGTSLSSERLKFKIKLRTVCTNDTEEQFPLEQRFARSYHTSTQCDSEK
jgi:hypothetical protein